MSISMSVAKIKNEHGLIKECPLDIALRNRTRKGWEILEKNVFNPDLSEFEEMSEIELADYIRKARESLPYGGGRRALMNVIARIIEHKEGVKHVRDAQVKKETKSDADKKLDEALRPQVEQATESAMQKIKDKMSFTTNKIEDNDNE